MIENRNVHRFLRNFFIVFTFLIGFPLLGYPYKVTVAYTGNSYASLYPCGRCPASVGGGITRRATVIKEIKDKTKNVVVVDSGNLTAGGAFDETSINPELDRKRSVFYYKALESIGYDAVGLGEGEFNFGLDFLIENLKNTKLRFISNNVALTGVLPYYIKDLADFPKGAKGKIAILGLSPLSLYKKVGIKVDDYETALRKTIDEVKAKVDLIILISPVGYEETYQLVKKFNDIRVAISSGDMRTNAPYEKAGDAVILFPSYQAKDIGTVELDINENKITDWKFGSKKLSLDLQEDSRIKGIIPACFQESNCAKKAGMIAQCQNPGELASACAYYEAKKIDVTVLLDQNCPFCSIAMPEQVLKNKFVGINFRPLHYEDAEAKKIIEKYALDSLPAFIFPPEIKEEKNFADISQFFDEKQKSFLLKKELSGIFLYLKRNETPRTIDFFLNLYDPRAASVFGDLVKFSKDNNITFTVHFVTPSINGAESLQEEVKLALAVKKLFPEKFFEYLDKRLKDIKSIYWVELLDELGIDYKKVKELAKSKTADELLRDSVKLTEELGIGEGNVLLVNNRQIFKVLQIKSEDLKKLFK